MSDAQRIRRVIESTFADRAWSNDQLTRAITELVTTIRQEERRAAFKDAVKIVEGLVCKLQFEGNWRNGYSHAQNDALRALEAAANENTEGSNHE